MNGLRLGMLNLKKIKYQVRNYVLIDAIIFFASKIPKHKVSSEKKLLIVQIEAMGDFLLFSPTLSGYREHFSDYSVTLLVEKNIKPLAIRYNQFVDTIIEFDRKKINRNALYRWFFLRSLAKAGYETVIYPTYSREVLADHMVRMTQANTKIGWFGDTLNIESGQKMKGDKYYTQLFDSPNSFIPEVERNAEFLELVTHMTREVRVPKLTTTPVEDEQVLEKYIQRSVIGNKPYAVIHPGASVSYKRWPIEKYLKCIEKLYHEEGITSVITGNSSEKNLSKYLKQKLTIPMVDLIGQTSILELAVLVKHSKLCVSNDTVAVHVAAAVGTPIVCIMGGGHFKRFFPYGDLQKNIIVYDGNAKCFNDNWKCGHGKVTAPCIDSISVEEVYQNISRLLTLMKP